MLSCEQFELASQRGEAAGLDLDQQVAADEIDDETVDDPFDAIAGASVSILELSVQCTLVERSDRRDLTFLGSGDLKDGAHDHAPSAPRRRCLRQVTTGPGPRPPLTREERPPPSPTEPCSGVRPVTGRSRVWLSRKSRRAKGAVRRAAGEDSTDVGPSRTSCRLGSGAVSRTALALVVTRARKGPPSADPDESSPVTV
jgi:hypothetical protein